MSTAPPGATTFSAAGVRQPESSIAHRVDLLHDRVTGGEDAVEFAAAAGQPERGEPHNKLSYVSVRASTVFDMWVRIVPCAL